MHERFKRRLAELEEARREQSQLSFVIALCFIDAKHGEVDATFASARDFTCRHGNCETLESFKERAIAECHEHYPRGIPPILIFFPEEPPNAA
jgi:hypothetical protein